MQLEEVVRGRGLLTVKKLLEGDRPSFLVLEELAECKVAVFPNPSPRAGRWKKDFYKNNKESAVKVLKEIHSMLR